MAHVLLDQLRLKLQGEPVSPVQCEASPFWEALKTALRTASLHDRSSIERVVDLVLDALLLSSRETRPQSIRHIVSLIVQSKGEARLAVLSELVHNATQRQELPISAGTVPLDETRKALLHELRHDNRLPSPIPEPYNTLWHKWGLFTAEAYKDTDGERLVGPLFPENEHLANASIDGLVLWQ